MGRNYVAWATVRGSAQHGFAVHRHGLLYDPDLGDTKAFGNGLRFWSGFFEHFIHSDLGVKVYGVERFTYRPGSTGHGAEDINLRLPSMHMPGGHLVRNTDWKSWFKRHVDPEGAEHYFRTPTTHEADAAGIALYTACVLMPRSQRIRPGT